MNVQRDVGFSLLSVAVIGTKMLPIRGKGETM